MLHFNMLTVILKSPQKMLNASLICLSLKLGETKFYFPYVKVIKTNFAHFRGLTKNLEF